MLLRLVLVGLILAVPVCAEVPLREDCSAQKSFCLLNANSSEALSRRLQIREPRNFSNFVEVDMVVAANPSFLSRWG